MKCTGDLPTLEWAVEGRRLFLRIFEWRHELRWKRILYVPGNSTNA